MAYRDPNKEAQITQTLQQQQQQKALNKTIKIPKRNYNIITHSGQKKESFHPSATRGDGTNPSSLDRNQREYNLLSHFNTKYHSVAPLEYDENISKHLLYKKIIPKKENYRSREFNILSNQYHQEHEDKQLQDHLIYQEKMKEKYWETHDYDLIKGQNYDEMKEKQYQEEMEKKRNQQLQKREQKFPKR